MSIPKLLLSKPQAKEKVMGIIIQGRHNSDEFAACLVGFRVAQAVDGLIPTWFSVP